MHSQALSFTCYFERSLTLDIQTILSQIEIGNYALPEFQRGYVWNREQVRKLMNSLYRGYPIGGLLVWVTSTNEDIVRGDGSLSPGTVSLILDGQQRITSLYGIIKGKPPQFFDGNIDAFTGLYFNLEEEVFEFYAPVKMKDNPNWIDISKLMKIGVGNFIGQAIQENAEENTFLLQHMEKLNQIDNIKKFDLHVQQVVGEDKTIDVVVEIFNNVNSGGTKLSKGDLALARICAQWPEARNEMKKILSRLERARYRFNQDWLLRCVTVYITGKAYFTELANIEIAAFQNGLIETSKLIDRILNQIASRLGLDYDRVLGSRYSIPLMVGYLQRNGGNIKSNNEWNKLLYWYIHTFLWGRYAGSTESVLAQDLATINNGEGVDGLINTLKKSRGDLLIRPENFIGWSTGSRFYPLLYMLTRVNHAKDWGSGLELSSALLGVNSALEVHHIFPKDVLYRSGFSKSEVNALGNYTFLTKETNLEISNKLTSEYLPAYVKRNKSAIESHWIPMDSSLYEVDKYMDFLSCRRELLAISTNDFLESLLSDVESTVIQDYVSRNDETDIDINEEDMILEASIWMEENGLPEGEIDFELCDEFGAVLHIIDIAWPNGVQVGLSEPIALMINESVESQNIVNQNGYKYFTSLEDLKEHVTEHYL